jgi:hypothetical protein
MSNIPIQKTGGDSDLATPEHDELLQWTWCNLEQIIGDVCVAREDYFEAMRLKAIDDYRKRMLHIVKFIKHYCNKRGSYPALTGFNKWETFQYSDYSPYFKELLLLADIFKKQSNEIQVPSIPPELFKTNIVNKSFQPELTTKNRSGTIHEVVGYVDIMAEINMVHKRNPFWLEGIANDSSSLEYFSPEDLCQVTPTLPQWERGSMTNKVYIDVRTELPSVGTLLRELKKVRELVSEKHDMMGERSIVMLVASHIPDQVCEILHNEGFVILNYSKYINNKEMVNVPDNMFEAISQCEPDEPENVELTPTIPPQEQSEDMHTSTLNLCEGLRAERSDRKFRCAVCREIQPAGSFIVYVPDGISPSDSHQTVTERIRATAYNYDKSGWCLSCAPKQGSTQPHFGSYIKMNLLYVLLFAGCIALLHFIRIHFGETVFSYVLSVWGGILLGWAGCLILWKRSILTSLP